MRIAYEEGDVVDVLADLSAGDFAGCTVELIEEIDDRVWLVKLVDDYGLYAPQSGIVSEHYFS